EYALFGKDKKYSETQAEHMVKDNEVMDQFDEWIDRFSQHVAQKGKVTPGKYRAYGFEPPSHMLHELKLGLRHFRMMIGLPPMDSSPDKQQDQELNDDVVLRYRKSEGDRLRE
ncbi:MAG: hypothetical protein M3R08_02330, partial [Bacteroidota bacterium]|nr:hypothetical protein [Bacteroidota bacterium]